MSADDTLAFETAFSSREVRPVEPGRVPLVEQLPMEVVTETAPRAVEFAHFLSWWDHFKATYRGRWWMRWRKWEVRYRVERRDFTARVVINLERFHAFPDPEFELPDLGKPVKIMRPRVNWIGWIE